MVDSQLKNEEIGKNFVSDLQDWSSCLRGLVYGQISKYLLKTAEDRKSQPQDLINAVRSYNGKTIERYSHVHAGAVDFIKFPDLLHHHMTE